MTLNATFTATLNRLFRQDTPEKIALAVSGGGDSMALLHLGRAWAGNRGVLVSVVTVDHGLRPESGAEAEFVARAAARLDLPHETLRWTSWDGQGNLQDAARTARRALIEGWARTNAISHVLTGHTADDQAETVLLRLARGSGVDGLAGISETERHDLTWLRPLLAMRRDSLRAYLRAENVDWVEDPSNDDLRFDRVRARRMMAGLADLGLTTERLLRTADHMQAARASLWAAARDKARDQIAQQAGDLILSPAVLDLNDSDTGRRLFAAAICWIASAPHRPRFASLRKAASALLAGQRTTLHGVLMTPEGAGFRLTREAAATTPVVRSQVAAGETMCWDNRWLMSCDAGHLPAGITLRALGESGLAHCPDWRESGLPRASLLASPSVWRDNTLVSAPLAGFARGWRARIVADFTQTLLSH
ncbi:MAG: tRNA lysidine(34) synthetase TilS [Rhodobacter sp.]|nr:tRNA lysidine(34) synthetase TilS [Rhodobacter sp.]